MRTHVEFDGRVGVVEMVMYR